ncbi:unnamed protein product, partial [Rhizoctonia solani]
LSFTCIAFEKVVFIQRRVAHFLTLSGILVTLLTNFLASKTDHQVWFKVYIFIVNVLTAGQTVIHVIQAFETIDLTPVHNTLVLAAPILTGLIGALVQAFFIHRCWKIYQQRSLATIPLILLWITSLVSAIMIGGYAAQSLTRPPSEATPELNVSSLLAERQEIAQIAATLSVPIVYFFCARKDLNARPSILAIVWQVLWASATPPLVLVIISIVDVYMIPGSPGITGVVAIGMMGTVNNIPHYAPRTYQVIGKVYVLSLMINIVGQGYIRQQFERRWTPSLHEETWMREQADQICNVDRSMVHLTVYTEEIELTTATRSISKNIGYKGSVEDELGRGITDAISLKDGL